MYGRLNGRIIGWPFFTKKSSDGYYNYSGIFKNNFDFFKTIKYKQSRHRRTALILSLLLIDLKIHGIHLSHHTLLSWQSTLAPATVDLPCHSSKTMERGVEYSREKDG